MDSSRRRSEETCHSDTNSAEAAAPALVCRIPTPTNADSGTRSRSGILAGAESEIFDTLSCFSDGAIINDIFDSPDGPGLDFPVEPDTPPSFFEALPSTSPVLVPVEYFQSDIGVEFGPAMTGWPRVAVDDIAAEVSEHLQLWAAAITARLATRWCVPPSEILSFEWAVEAAVLTHRRATERLIVFANNTLVIDLSGSLLFPVVGKLLDLSAACPL